MQNESTKNLRRSRLKLLLLLAIFAAPMVAGYAAYFFFHPTHFTNYGTLVKPYPLQDAALVTADGRPLHLGQLHGKWVLITASSGPCAADCRQRLHAMQVARLLQGRDQDRIERVWLQTGPTPAGNAAPGEGARAVRESGQALSHQLQTAGHTLDAIYVIDPMGNLMMRYDPPVDIKRMAKDLKTLLGASQVG